MTDIHRRVSRRISNFLTNSKSADHVAAEVIQMIAEQQRNVFQEEFAKNWGNYFKWQAAQGIEAGTDETPKAAQPVGREPGCDSNAPKASREGTPNE